MRAAAATLLAALLSGCMPWVAGETAETAPAGRVEPGGGLALLAPPDELDRPLPVPQAQLTIGVRDGLDFAATWAPPLTFQARGKLRVRGGPGGAAAVTAGGGVHGIPDVAGAGTRFWTPFLVAGAVVSTRGPAPRRYAVLRVIAPFDPADGTITAWWVAQGGIELEWRGLAWGPEGGVVVPALHADRPQLLLAVSARRRRLP